MSPTFQIWAIVAAGGLFLLLLTSLPPSFSLSALPLPFMSELGDSWLARLMVNLIGYSTVLIPGYLIRRYVAKSNFMDDAGKGCTRSLVSACFYGDESSRSGGGLSLSGVVEKQEDSSALPAALPLAHRAWRLLFCFLGLQLSYLTWGVLQEKIMTLDYSAGGAEGPERFTDSQFLVFVNRVLALALSGAYLLARRQPRHGAPLYRYSYCSFSNVMSSWCQYEALKYVSFPTQVLAKACKIIPVMAMGRLVSRRTYESYEYVTAGLISLGMTLFLLGTADDRPGGAATTASGAVILGAYVLFDSFTSNWQGELFRQHRVTPAQMMCGVNLFSCLFTAVSLLQQGGFVESFYFAARHHAFLRDIALLSLASAAGQLFVFTTIARFGAIVFIIMMTARQGLAILLSVVLYQHAVTAAGVLGIALVFASVFLRIYCEERQKTLRARRAALAAVDVRV